MTEILHVDESVGLRPEGTAPRDVAEAVGATLARLGVDVAFGLIGSGNFVATHALAAGGVRFIGARHEGPAVAMADGWARVSGRVGVASVHTGPGLTNAITALAEAAKSRTPLVVLSGDVPATSRRTNFRINQHGVVESVGAIAERVHGPDTAVADVTRAMRRAEVERRPVVLMMPMDIQAQPMPEDALDLPPAGPVLRRPSPAPEAIAEVADLVEAARRPVIIAGRGAVLSSARDPLEALGARIGALMATSAVAAGLFNGLPYDVRVSGGFATPLADELIGQADIVLAFGAALNYWTTRHGHMFGADAAIVQVDVDPDAIGVHHPVRAAVVGDVHATAIALARELERRDHRATGFRTAEVAERISHRRRWRDEPFEERSGASGMDPRRLSIAVDDLLPAERQVVTDSGGFVGFPAIYLEVPGADDFIFPNAYQSVGLGLGESIGAAVGRPDRVTVLGIGDGGTLMALGELETAARLGLPLLILVYDDSAAGAEALHYGPLGYDLGLVRFPDVDLAAIARSAGMEAITARTPDELAPIAQWARDPRGPLLVDAKVDPTAPPGSWVAEAFRNPH